MKAGKLTETQIVAILKQQDPGLGAYRFKYHACGRGQMPLKTEFVFRLNIGAIRDPHGVPYFSLSVRIFIPVDPYRTSSVAEYPARYAS